MKKNIIALLLILPIAINLLVFNSAEVVVNAVNVPVVSIALDKEYLDFDRLDTTQPIVATISPAQATNKSVSFVSSDPNVATVDANGIVTAVANGTAFVTATTLDGGFTATCAISVQSYFLQSFDLELVGNSQLYEEDSAQIKVTVAPKEAISSSVPLIEQTDDRILDISPFTLSNETRTQKEFVATVKARRIGESTIRVYVEETQTDLVFSQTQRFEVLTSLDASIRFLYDGATYHQEKPLVVAANVLPLHVNRQVQSLSFSIEEEGGAQTNLAEITDTQNGQVLTFTRAGTIKLSYTSDTESGFCYITSTYGQILPESFQQLAELSTLNLFVNSKRQLQLDIKPYDFLDFYDVNWTYTSGIVFNRYSATNVIFWANVHNAQTINVSFVHKNTQQSTDFSINVSVYNYGLSNISIELNTPALKYRGLEQTYVVGNKDFAGEGFVTTLKYSSTAPNPNATRTVLYESSDTSLATVNSEGEITFNKNISFDMFTSKFVDITITSLHPYNDNDDKASDTYTFEIVHGANVYNSAQFFASINNSLDIVLQSALSFSATTRIPVSIYGNGFQLDAHAFTNNMNSQEAEIFIFLNNNNFQSWVGQGNPVNTTLITNVVFSGFADSDLLSLMKKGTLVSLYASTTMQYCVLQRASALLFLPCEVEILWTPYPVHDVWIYKNILRTAGYAGMYIGAASDRPFGPDASNVRTQNIVFEDLIFEDTLFGMLFEPGEVRANRPIAKYEPEIRGTIEYYNWIKQDELNKLFLYFDIYTVPLSAFGFEGTQYKGETYCSLAVNLFYITGLTHNPRTNLEEMQTYLNKGFTKKKSQDFQPLPSIQAYAYMEYFTPNSTVSSPQKQEEHFANPDYSLVTAQEAAR